MKISNEVAMNAWERLDAVIGSLDWSGVFINDELDIIEQAMSILEQYIIEKGGTSQIDEAN